MKIGFIGGGNMAAALIGGLRKQGISGSAIRVVERDGTRRDVLATEFGVAATDTPDRDLLGAAVLILAVKPGQIREVCEALDAPAPGRLLVSIAAGIPSASIARWARTESVVRAMPNTPALIGEGITGAFAREGVTAQQREAATRILQAVGDAVWFGDEAMLDTVTAISGSGPAYVFYFLEALQDAAQRMGMDATQARHFAVRTCTGAARLAAQSPESLATLRERVTSKGGTTAAALAQFAQSGLHEAIVAGALAAQARSRELARELPGS
ncbi:pyrroline-5-carboxylate reductase [Burkholderiales bacterium GJ-E10]|nr:pyrroline-5-carboxylate reductase [Burkholderiales bacterium GJ-E10]